MSYLMTKELEALEECLEAAAREGASCIIEMRSIISRCAAAVEEALLDGRSVYGPRGVRLGLVRLAPDREDLWVAEYLLQPREGAFNTREAAVRWIRQKHEELLQASRERA